MAAASDAKAAKMLGININKTRMLTFGISTLLACASGVLLAPMYYVSPDLGGEYWIERICSSHHWRFQEHSGSLGGRSASGYRREHRFRYDRILLPGYHFFCDHVDYSLLQTRRALAKRVEQKF